MKVNNQPWCLLDAGIGKQKFVCNRCNQEHIFEASGIELDYFVRIMEAFCLLHKNCKETGKTKL
jgi:hypothetical protein